MPLSLSLETRTIEELRKFSDTFVETGTHTGGAVQSALEAGFEVIMSCELNPFFMGYRVVQSSGRA